MMIVDMNAAAKPFGDCSKELEKLGEEIGVNIKCQQEEIFQTNASVFNRRVMT